jgi:hypothetical protein
MHVSQCREATCAWVLSSNGQDNLYWILIKWEIQALAFSVLRLELLLFTHPD